MTWMPAFIAVSAAAVTVSSWGRMTSTSGFCAMIVLSWLTWSAALAAWVRLKSTSSYLVACFLALTLIAPVQPWSADGALKAILILAPAWRAGGGGVAVALSPGLGPLSALGGCSALRQAP